MNRTRYVLPALALGLLALGLLATLATTPLAAQSGSIRGTVTDSSNSDADPGRPGVHRRHVIPHRDQRRGPVPVCRRGAGNSGGSGPAHRIRPGPDQRRCSAGQEATADFALAPGVAQLEEIVSVGYGTQTRGELASAISSVKADGAGGPADRQRGWRAPGQGARRPGGPERRQPRERPQRAHPRLRLGVGEQRSALRDRRRAHDLGRCQPARRRRPEHRRAQRAQPGRSGERGRAQGRGRRRHLRLARAPTASS